MIELRAPHYHEYWELTNVWRDEWSWNPVSRLVQQIASCPELLTLLSCVFGRRAFSFMCAVWAALEDVHTGSGPLFYYPGSHRLPILTNAQLGLSAPVDESGYRRFEDAWEAVVEVEGLERRQLLAKRGQALIWTANLVHGGEPIEDPSTTRHSQATHYFFDDCLYWTPLHSDPMRGEIVFREPLDVSARS